MNEAALKDAPDRRSGFPSGAPEASREGEAAQSRSDIPYRALFDAIDQGFSVVDLIFDEDDRPVDYVFVEVNPAFEVQTGLHDAIGRSMRSLHPDHEDHWFETYGRVALTGEPVRFEHEATALGRWYNVFACRIGEPERRQHAKDHRRDPPRHAVRPVQECETGDRDRNHEREIAGRQPLFHRRLRSEREHASRATRAA